MFFPMPDDWKGIAAAKMVCARCNVQTDCAAYAVRERYGVWGGLSERDRRRLRRILDRRGVRWPDPVELGRLIEGLRAA